ncbi:XdhC family protein [Peribacillus frigoritolerans]|nr:XdhC family protein [Peribacillus frigoritolerans]
MEKVAMLTRQNETFALAMIIESKGSTPRHVGKMIVYRDGTIEGTVGGGLAEHYVIEDSVKAIQDGQSKIVEYKLNKHAKDGIQMNMAARYGSLLKSIQAGLNSFWLGLVISAMRWQSSLISSNILIALSMIALVIVQRNAFRMRQTFL